LLTDYNERDIVWMYKIIDKNKEQRCLHKVGTLLFLFFHIYSILARDVFGN